MRLGQAGRYAVLDKLGEGVSGRVYRCRDRTSPGVIVAVKVSRATTRQRRQAETEASILRDLSRRGDKHFERHASRLLDTFVHDDRHFCLVFEPLAGSLRSLLHDGGGHGLLLCDVRRITLQLLCCLAFLHAAGLAHMDLKSTNVMLRDDAFDLVPHPRERGSCSAPQLRSRCEAVLIDFAGAAAPGSRPGVRLGARHIRAPEVVLGQSWDEAADLWGLGCLLFTLYTGKRAFQVHHDMEHLATMERLLETRIPRSMSRGVSDRVLAKGVAFDGGRLLWPSRAPSDELVDKVAAIQPVREQVLPRHPAFLSLLRGLLEIAPSQRLGTRDALKSPFVTCEEVVE